MNNSTIGLLENNFKIEEGICVEEYLEKNIYPNMFSRKLMIFNRIIEKKYIGTIFYAMSERPHTLLEVIKKTRIKNQSKICKDIVPVVALNNEKDEFDTFFIEDAQIDSKHRGRGFFKKVINKTIERVVDSNRDYVILLEMKDEKTKKLKSMYLYVFNEILETPFIYIHQEEKSLFLFVVKIRVKR